MPDLTGKITNLSTQKHKRRAFALHKLSFPVRENNIHTYFSICGRALVAASCENIVQRIFAIHLVRALPL